MDDSAIEYDAVTSSNLEAVGYDAPARRLWVKFLGGRKYRYEKVPPDLYAGLIAAGSKGKYLDARVKKGGYEFHDES